MNALKHDFYNNYYAFHAAGDNSMTKELLLGELAYLIDEHRATVIQTLRVSGVKVKYSSSDKKIVKAITANSDNKKMLKGLSLLIAKANSESLDKKLNADGDGKGGIDPISAVSGALNALFGYLSQPGKKARKESADLERDKMNKELLAKLAEQKSKADRGLNWPLYITIGVGVILIGTITIVAIRKNKKKKIAAAVSVAAPSPEVKTVKAPAQEVSTPPNMNAA